MTHYMPGLLVAFLASFIVVSPSASAGNVAVVENLADEIEQRYVFVDVANDIAVHLRERMAKGAYDSLAGEALAVQLTDDLRAISKDKHLDVRYRPEITGEQDRRLNHARQAGKENYGFTRVEMLEDSVGVIALSEFHELEMAPGMAPEMASEMASEMARAMLDASMAKLADAKVLIFDLRENRVGGDQVMVAAITSYLFADRRHLNTMQNRITGTADYDYEEFHTTPVGAERARPDVPVYVLISGSTFSAGEEFSYNLKHMERATLIGEVTGGGANPGGVVQLGAGFTAFIPDGRAVNPITQTNWEGVGVKPHIEVPAEQALEKALQLIRESD